MANSILKMNCIHVNHSDCITMMKIIKNHIYGKLIQKKYSLRRLPPKSMKGRICFLKMYLHYILVMEIFLSNQKYQLSNPTKIYSLAKLLLMI